MQNQALEDNFKRALGRMQSRRDENRRLAEAKHAATMRFQPTEGNALESRESDVWTVKRDDEERRDERRRTQERDDTRQQETEKKKKKKKKKETTTTTAKEEDEAKENGDKEEKEEVRRMVLLLIESGHLFECAMLLLQQPTSPVDFRFTALRLANRLVDLVYTHARQTRIVVELVRQLDQPVVMATVKPVEPGWFCGLVMAGKSDLASTPNSLVSWQRGRRGDVDGNAALGVFERGRGGDSVVVETVVDDASRPATFCLVPPSLRERHPACLERVCWLEETSWAVDTRLAGRRHAPGQTVRKSWRRDSGRMSTTRCRADQKPAWRSALGGLSRRRRRGCASAGSKVTGQTSPQPLHDVVPTRHDPVVWRQQSGSTKRQLFRTSSPTGHPPSSPNLPISKPQSEPAHSLLRQTASTVSATSTVTATPDSVGLATGRTSRQSVVVPFSGATATAQPIESSCSLDGLPFVSRASTPVARLQATEPGFFVRLLETAIMEARQIDMYRPKCKPSLRRRACGPHCIQVLTARLLVCMSHAKSCQERLVQEGHVKSLVDALHPCADPVRMFAWRVLRLS